MEGDIIVSASFRGKTLKITRQYHIIDMMLDVRAQDTVTLNIIRNGEEKMETGLQKVGAMLGDYVEIGCNTVLNPGTVVGKNSTIYPTSCVRGVVPADHIWKGPGKLVKKEAR